VLALCSPAQGQQPKKLRRIGFLSALAISTNIPFIEAFRQGLRNRGYAERQNVSIEYRYAEGNIDRLSALAAELVGLKVEVIVTGGES
jgi:putative ABC transport system substrate-binding protein